MYSIDTLQALNSGEAQKSNKVKKPVKKAIKWDSYTATMVCEGVEEASRAEQIEAWQYLIDTGLAWLLQGFFGRQATALIEMGLCYAKQ